MTIRTERHARYCSPMPNKKVDELTRLADLAGALALHFDRGREPERAADYYLRAARRALAVYADQEAQAAASRGLELAAEPHTQFALLALREEVCYEVPEQPAPVGRLVSSL